MLEHTPATEGGYCVRGHHALIYLLSEIIKNDRIDLSSSCQNVLYILVKISHSSGDVCLCQQVHNQHPGQSFVFASTN